MHLHVLPEGRGMGVALVAAAHFAVVRFVAGVNVRMFLAIRRIGESSIAAFEFALEGFFS